MPQYNVHIYREMRLRFDAIDAASSQEAAELARNMATKDATEVEDCEGTNLAALVDLVGDTEFENSVTLDFESKLSKKSTQSLYDALVLALEFLKANDDDEEDVTSRIAVAEAAIRQSGLGAAV